MSDCNWWNLFNKMSRGEIQQAKRDLKTMKKAHSITHDPVRKRNAHVFAEIENERLESRITEGAS